MRRVCSIVFVWLILSTCAFSAIAPHPRLLGASVLPLGAADGSTVGSLRYKAHLTPAPTSWVNFCQATDFVYGISVTGNSGANIIIVNSLLDAYRILNGMSVSFTTCTHSTVADYLNQSISMIETWITFVQNGNCAGTGGTFGSCNATTKPPFHGNDMRNIVTYAALVYDRAAPFLNATDKANLGTIIYLSYNGFIDVNGLGQYGQKQGYPFGAGPGANGYQGMWAGTGLSAWAVQGDGIDPSDTSSGCVHGAAACNNGINAFLNKFFAADIPWFTLQTVQQNAYPADNGCTLPKTQGSYTYTCPGVNCWLTNSGGGDGCGAGGMPTDGWEYGQTTQIWYVFLVDAITSADSSLNLWTSIGQIETDFCDFILHNISPWKDSLGFPNFNNQQHYSDEQTAYKPTSTEVHWAAEILANHEGTSSRAGWLRNYYRNIAPCFQGFPCNNNDKLERWKDVMWDDDTQAAVDPMNGGGTISPGFSLDYLAKGGTVQSRSDTTTNAAWVTFSWNEHTQGHAQNGVGEAVIGYKGQNLLLHPVGYGGTNVPWPFNPVHNTVSFQSTNEVGAGNFWRAAHGSNTGNTQPQWKALEVDSQGRFIHVWLDLAPEMGGGTANAYTARTTKALFTGTGLNNAIVTQGQGPPTVGTEDVYTATVSANGSPDSITWACAAPSAPAVGGGCTHGASGSGPMSCSFLVGNVPFKWANVATGACSAATLTGHTIGDSWKVFSDNWGPWNNFNTLVEDLVYVKNAQFPYVVKYIRGTTLLNTNLTENIPMPYTTLPTAVAGVIKSINNGESLFVQPVTPNNTTQTIQDYATLPELWGFGRSLAAAGPTGEWNNGVGGLTLSPIAVSKVTNALGYIRTVTASTSPALMVSYQAADSSVTPSGVENLTATGLSCDHIMDSQKDQVVCFSSSNSGAVFTATNTPTSITWTRVSSSSNIQLYDLANAVLLVQVSEAGSNTTLSLAAIGCGTCGGYQTFNVSDQGSLILADPLTGGALTIVPPSLTNGVSGLAYSQTFGATGGTPPYTWSETGSLPTGMSFNSSGTISGTPTQTGTFPITWRVTDSLSATTAVQIPLTTVSPVSITTNSLPGGQISTAYSQVVVATGGNVPYVNCVSSVGALPNGLTYTAVSNGCQISGTPTVAGTFNFTTQVSDSTRASAGGPSTATQPLSIVISNIPTNISITTTSPLPAGTAGQQYNQPMNATGGTGIGYTWTNPGGGLPPGITLSSSGVLSGTPTTPGTYTPTIQVTDSASNTTSSPFTLVISPGIVISPGTVPNALQNQPYSVSFTQTGGTAPVTWSVGGTNQPPGININPASGIFSGTATQAGNFTFTVTVVDVNNIQQTNSYQMTVNSGVAGNNIVIKVVVQQ